MLSSNSNSGQEVGFCVLESKNLIFNLFLFKTLLKKNPKNPNLIFYPKHNKNNNKKLDQLKKMSLNLFFSAY